MRKHKGKEQQGSRMGQKGGKILSDSDRLGDEMPQARNEEQTEEVLSYNRIPPPSGILEYELY